MHRKSNELRAGMVIIELMISLTLGLIILSILASIYLASQHAYSLQTALQAIQDDARTTIAILTEDIKKAGYIGCRQLTNDFSVVSALPYSLTVQNKLMDNGGHLQIRHMSDPNTVLRETMKDSSILHVDKDIHFSVGEIGIISDCQQAEIFQIQAVSLTKELQILITTYPLKHIFKKNAEVGKLDIHEYWLAKSNDVNLMHDSQYALYVSDIHHRKTELVPHLEQMKMKYSVFQYGQLIDKNSEDIQDWSTVQGVSIDLVFKILTIRKAWHTYISLRI